MKKVLLAIFVVATLVSSANADIVFSTNKENALEGADFQMQIGQTRELYVFISTPDGALIQGIGLDILSSNDAVLDATDYQYEDAAARWPIEAETGDLGDLVTNANASSLAPIIGQGLGTSGLDDFALFSTLTITATEIGQTDLSFAINSNGFGATGYEEGDIVFGTGSVGVAAIPEPGTVGVLSAVGLGFGFYTYRRRRQQKAAKA